MPSEPLRVSFDVLREPFVWMGNREHRDENEPGWLLDLEPRQRHQLALLYALAEKKRRPFYLPLPDDSWLRCDNVETWNTERVRTPYDLLDRVVMVK